MATDLHGKELPDEEVEFILIGAGLPRTGTMSTFTALEMILPGACHHMARVHLDKTKRNVTHWKKVAKGNITDQEWRQFVRDERLSAAVDYPMSLFWKDLVRLFPKAKVLLSIRDPVKWHQSVKNTILEINLLYASPLVTFNPILRLAMFILGRPAIPEVAKLVCNAETPAGPQFPMGLFGAVMDGEEEAVQFFNAWKNKVVSEVPAERLLVWEVKQGWEPLCQFLDVPVPDVPFPNVNDTPTMLSRIRFVKRIVFGTWAVVIGGLAASAYYVI